MVTDADPILELREVSKRFAVGRASVVGGTRHLRAVDHVSLAVPRQKTFGLVGESGSGKSTLARLIMRLVDSTSGRIVFDGEDITSVSGRRLRQYRHHCQMVFQDPFSSFDPSARLGNSVLEPLQGASAMDGRDRKSVAGELFELVGLAPSLADRFPRELSGGQLQRAAVARAISTRPKLVVLDEPVSALDVSTQAQVVNLLRQLQDQLGLSYVFVGHDLSVVRHISQQLGVMYMGRIVEMGPTVQIFAQPRHPYTQSLLAAILVPDPIRQRQRQRAVVRGEMPSPLQPPSGCHFRTRCPYAMAVCASVDPPASVIGDIVVHCHLYGEGTGGGDPASVSTVPMGGET